MTTGETTDSVGDLFIRNQTALRLTAKVLPDPPEWWSDGRMVGEGVGAVVWSD